jgi:cell division protein FtsB
MKKSVLCLKGLAVFLAICFIFGILLGLVAHAEDLTDYERQSLQIQRENADREQLRDMEREMDRAERENEELTEEIEAPAREGLEDLRDRSDAILDNQPYCYGNNHHR